MTQTKTMSMVWYALLAITGGLACLAIFVPDTVIMGLYLLLLPGLILMLAPIVFVALCLFLSVRIICGRFTNSKLATGLGLAAVMVLAIAPPFIDRLRAKAAIAAVAQPDIIPAGQIALSGAVEFRLPANSPRASGTRGQRHMCGPLCLDLLHRPDVESVTEVHIEANKPAVSKRYRLLRDAACAEAKRVQAPNLIVPQDMTSFLALGTNEEIYHARKSAFDGGRTCLITEPLRAGRPDYAIALSDENTGGHDLIWNLFAKPPVSRSTAEIFDKGGAPLFRASYFVAQPLSIPLRTGFAGASGSKNIGFQRGPMRHPEDGKGDMALLYSAILGPQYLATRERQR
jgi:hypothetical protein